ncbi:hypothetical protein MtrunA17_Chr6g0452191 [Medicago truncatula]|uniref:Transmembrane protein, putative n=1 Tax=Medicago truncatula TaxID=3880 RepID=G7KJZ7_MEDTR|nr:uncharacterized protein LOC11430260 [Medicago truncatula]AES74636.1 transmembrane protein, putative [Medicago truncatula]RHN49954.1 hypothetical protein MtrunA17_Chr6g0452191 [Medicago truncatula]
MEMKKSECERETKEEEFNEDSIQTIMFTLGTFLLMVCLKSFLVEKWRAYVFLILNVILLAILFMSMKPNYWKSRNLESESNVEEVKNDDKLKKSACESSQEIEENKECYKQHCWISTNISSTNHVHVENEIDEEEEEEDEHVEVLSKEELNERVEAFIAMFRKHLISDVKQGEDFRHQKTSNLTPKIEVSCC